MSELIDRMSAATQVPPSTILKVAGSASHHYKRYTIPKVDGSRRVIHQPSRSLKLFQRWLVHYVFNTLPIHEAAAAYRSGVAPRAHVDAHRLNSYVLRLDLENFFPSITYGDVERFLIESRFEPKDAALSASLICKDGGLTVGAPSSPHFSNAICFELDSRISAYSSRSKISYTRYADDMFFSTSQKNVLSRLPADVKKILRELEVPANLRLNESKVWHASKRGRRRITGLTITPEGRVTVGRPMKRKIRALVHRYALLTPDQRRTLAGYISYVASVEPEFLNALILKYGIDQVERARIPPQP